MYRYIDIRVPSYVQEILELRMELERKEKLIEKHHERLQFWINLLQRNTVAPLPPSSATGSSQQSTMPPQPQGQGYPGPPQQPGPGSMSQGGLQTGQYPGPPLPMGQGYSMPPPHQMPPSYPQNPLTFLEQNLSNIGMPERR